MDNITLTLHVFLLRRGTHGYVLQSCFVGSCEYQNNFVNTPFPPTDSNHLYTSWLSDNQDYVSILVFTFFVIFFMYSILSDMILYFPQLFKLVPSNQCSMTCKTSSLNKINI